VKIAIVYNRDSRNVINLFGLPNRERIGLRTIRRIADALRSHKHRVESFEGDKDLIDRLEEFMPRVLKGERPGLVFNVSYGIQGQARYTHVPSILEMVGIPYVGSGPLAHALALDKVVTKMIFQQQGLPTPDFRVINPWEADSAPDLPYPLIVKPKNEAVSFGVRVVENQADLKEAVTVVFETFQQPAVVESFIEGREINVGLIGNSPAEVFAPVELTFGAGGPSIYTYEDKVGNLERRVGFECPARVDAETTSQAQDLARRAFEALGCYDCARVDMRLDERGRLYLLEVNSLPSLGEHGSYTVGAAHAGLDYPQLVNRLVEVASARYFGTPKPPQFSVKDADPGQLVLSFLSQRRDQIERRLQNWTALHSRTSDAVGIREAARKLAESLKEIGLEPAEELTNGHTTWGWQTPAGLAKGTLLIGHLDVPLSAAAAVQEFRRDPEWLYGEGIGLSRAPLVALEFVLRALKNLRRLRRLPVGVLYYADEGRDCADSTEIIRQTASQAARVLVLRPGNPESKVVTQRRGWRRYRLHAEGTPKRLGKAGKKPDVLRWMSARLDGLAALSSTKDRLTVAASNLRTHAFPMLLPHAVDVTVMVSYGEKAVAEETETKMREILAKDGIRWELEMLSDRPPMKSRATNRRLAEALAGVATHWEIPFGCESSLWPSVAGLVPAGTAVVCGMGPVAKDLYQPHEAVSRISILQRTLLLAEFLAKES
jgi:D-alanine-D-alanine ligase